MKEFYAKAIINAPVHVVWQAITNPVNHIQLDANCSAIKGSIKHGSTIKVMFTSHPSMVWSIKISKLHHSKVMKWNFILPFNIFKRIKTFTVFAKDDATTEFRMQETFGGIFPAVFKNMIPDMSKPLSQFCKGLKKNIESRV